MTGPAKTFCLILALCCGVAFLVAGCGSEDVDLTPPELTLTVPTAFPLDKVFGPNQFPPPYVFGGTVESGASLSAIVSSGVAVTGPTVVGGTWSASIPALAQGFNTVSLTASDKRGNLSNLVFTMSYDEVAPALSNEQFLTPTASDNQVLAGTVEAGVASLTVSADTTATCAPLLINGTTWSCPASGLVPGVNTFTITATDNAANVTSFVRGISYNAAGPGLTVDPLAPTASSGLTLSGTRSVGHTVQVVPPVGVVAADIAYPDASHWSCALSNLAVGVNQVGLQLLDAGATAVASGAVQVIRDTAPPTVTATVPAAGASVALASTTEVTATFAEQLVAAGVDATSFTVVDALAAPVPGAVTWDAATRTATFTPTAPFVAGRYTATLAATLTDLAGNPLPAAYGWTFTLTP